MSIVGNYLYGFTRQPFQPAADLRGLAGAPVRVVTFGDVAAVVSRHPVKPLMPLRSNLEPHHRIVRRISSEAPLLPAAFGHITQNDREIVDVLRENYDDIREELERLNQKCEMGIKLCWNVGNIFEFFVRNNRELRELRDRVFTRREPSLAEKLQVGEKFEATLNRERERLTAAVLNPLRPIASDIVKSTPRQDRIVCKAELLIARADVPRFEETLRHIASRLDAHFTLDYSGPWPPYSFVRLRLQRGSPTAAA
jgi:hypothetical protein